MRIDPMQQRHWILTAGCAAALVWAGWAVRANDLDQRIIDSEARRVAIIAKVKPAVVAIFARGGQGGGSGVLISKDGYALTNFHVVQGSGPIMHCGLPDGVLYDAVLVGLDRVGDVALIKLLPKKPGDEFPYVTLGDSDKVQTGDWSLAMGNPFLLATDFTPTVTYGLISGVHRYQYPAGALLEYTDCIQIDTSINPGNSGGPLFNMDGELIGINGRGSFEKRGRVNSGVGYAISINQIKNFLGHLRAGLDTDHATLGALIETDKDDDRTERLVVRSILEDCDVRRRGLDLGDELVSFAGRPMTSVNQYKNVLGLFPKDWRVPLVYRRDNQRTEILVRLMGVLPEAQNGDAPRPDGGRPRPEPRVQPSVPNSPAAKLYEPKPGFANFYFNRLERDRLWAAFRKHGDFSTLTGEWALEADVDSKLRKTDAQLSIAEEADGKTLVKLVIGGLKYELEPLKVGQKIEALRDPPGSGGLMLALYHYRRLLTLGEKGFKEQFSHGGHEPFYPPPAGDAKPRSLRDLRVDTEVLRTEYADVAAKWYFSLTDQTLLGFEVFVEKDQDPCEVYLADYRPVDGRSLPHRMEVRYGNDRYATFTIKNYRLTAGK
ncbi:MAG: trypsin-like peptidase domain-containing protein, partial [Gemmataceae bacterium]|nr:trypsin-like peptidase domain-containing protein [Gemmataceae bacterium]MDW8266412.1 trypsin-like peptidase domain-containing protein [Gemmataceae bacterium]